MKPPPNSTRAVVTEGIRDHAAGPAVDLTLDDRLVEQRRLAIHDSQRRRIPAGDIRRLLDGKAPVPALGHVRVAEEHAGVLRDVADPAAIRVGADLRDTDCDCPACR